MVKPWSGPMKLISPPRLISNYKSEKGIIADRGQNQLKKTRRAKQAALNPWPADPLLNVGLRKGLFRQEEAAVFGGQYNVVSHEKLQGGGFIVPQRFELQQPPG